MKRQLTETEKRICFKQIERIKEELKHLDYLNRYYKSMLDEGLYFNYQERIRQTKQQLDEIQVDVKLNYEKINNLQNQIKNGVEVIEEKTPLGIG